MMKRLIVLGMVLAMVVALSVSASAFIIRIQSAAGDGTASSFAGQVSNEQNAFTPLNPALSAEATYVVYKDNVVSAEAANQGHTLKVLDLAGPTWTYYGSVTGRTGFNGAIDLRFFSTTTASKLAGGTWYLYRGTGIGSEADVLDSGTFSTTESSWALSTFKATFASGDLWTLSNQGPEGPIVPEPGSIVALLSGIVGLGVIRRRK